MNRFTLLLAAVLTAPSTALAQAGVLVVEGHDEPDPSILALAQMEVVVRLDHFHASVSIAQIFENRTSDILRGRYELALGEGAAVSSFAIWEGEHRRVGVVVERERGRRIFEELTARNIDPGLLETADEGPRQNVYAVRVDPILPYSRMRVEVGYSQEVDVAGDEAIFVFPLGARDYEAQSAAHLVVQVRVEGAWPIESVELRPEDLALTGPMGAGRTGLEARLEGRDVELSQDVQIALRLARDPARPLRPVLLAYRKPIGRSGGIDRSALGGGRRYTDDRGYFVLRTPVQVEAPAADQAPPHDIVVALDASLSMRGAKLQRAVAAVEGLLSKMRPADRFGLVVFNDEVRTMGDGLDRATPERLSKARDFFRSGYLSGGTDLREGLDSALRLLEGSTAAQRTVVVLTDGQPTLTALDSTSIARDVGAANGRLGASKGRLFILGVGDDANHILLRRLADESEGLYAHVGESADVEPVLRTFARQLIAGAVQDLRATFEGAQGIEDLYPAGPSRVFDGSSYVLYGRYRAPSPRARVTLAGTWQGRPLQAALGAALPGSDTGRLWVARGWARRRVDDLLARIDAEGERPEWVAEIVALAREHMLVTPYTSLIAAARSALRPRSISPGDPVLRLRTDPSDRAVVAVFPFGLTKELRRIEPGVWETRFVAPVSIEQGRHDVDLIITGADGRLRRVRDYFVIDEVAPMPTIAPLRGPVRAGTRLRLRAFSDQDTRTLTAFLAGVPAAELRWNADEQACVGDLAVPRDLPTGRHHLVLVAEDQAHNVGTATAELEVLGR